MRRASHCMAAGFCCKCQGNGISAGRGLMSVQPWLQDFNERLLEPMGTQRFGPSAIYMAAAASHMNSRQTSCWTVICKLSAVEHASLKWAWWSTLGVHAVIPGGPEQEGAAAHGHEPLPAQHCHRWQRARLGRGQLAELRAGRRPRPGSEVPLPEALLALQGTSIQSAPAHLTLRSAGETAEGKPCRQRKPGGLAPATSQGVLLLIMYYCAAVGGRTPIPGMILVNHKEQL